MAQKWRAARGVGGGLVGVFERTTLETAKDAVHAVLEGRVVDFGEKAAEQASRLFHYTGRRRGSHADCMIAAAAMTSGVRVATRNVKDFERFVPHGLQLLPVETAA